MYIRASRMRYAVQSHAHQFSIKVMVTMLPRLLSAVLVVLLSTSTSSSPPDHTLIYDLWDSVRYKLS